MGFEGNLSSVSFPDILQLLAMGKNTGTLIIKKGEYDKEICFKEGSIIWATSSLDSELLENHLLKNHKISKEDLTRAKEVMNLTEKSLPSTLVFLGLMAKEEIAEMMLKHVESIVFDVFNWPDGDFAFKDGVLPDSEHVINALNTMSILMEGTRRIDEWNRIRQTLPRENTVLKVVVSDNGMDQEEIRLTNAEARVLSLIDGQRSLEEVREKSPYDELETSRAIYGLIMGGLVCTGGLKESKKAKIQEKKRLLEVTVQLYEIVFDIIREDLHVKLGGASQRLLKSAYKKKASEHPVLENITIDDDGRFRFVNFITLAERLPEESRIHLVSNGLGALFAEMANRTGSTMGNRQKKRTMSRIIERGDSLLSDNSDLLKKYSVYSDFYRVIQS